MRHLVPAVLLLLAACKSEASKAEVASQSSDNPHAALPSALPSGHSEVVSTSGGLMPTQTAPRILDKLTDGRVALGPFSLQVPADWTEKPSVSNMRAAQFELPGAPGEVEVLVYHFGQNGAGSVQDNIDRWVSQFSQADGKPSSELAAVEQATLAGQAATVVSVSGRYVARAMPGGQSVDKPDQSLVAAIVPSPRGPYYFRLIGARAAVAAQTEKFRGMLASLRLE
ncbi:MAG TPA: hypothetical protein VJU61_14595 [Polyangiaceae bacterium]|nr:hypothetical protein [Polyangiaceae bacterium]